jgi:hypothetical protein
MLVLLNENDGVFFHQIDEFGVFFLPRTFWKENEL